MKGVRYYLPRPFLHLKQPIPVAQRVAFISFTLNEKEGAYILDRPKGYETTWPTWLKRVVPDKLSLSQALAATTAKTRAKAAVQQAGEPNVPTTAKPTEPPPSTMKATTGFINQTDPVTKLSDKMDIVYLPDFEEQYVIRVDPGLGKADVETRLRNGWAAEIFSQDLDNSQVIPYVIRQVEKASEAAAGIATTWMPLAAGLPPGTLPAGISDLEAAEMQAGAVREDVAMNIAKNVLGRVLLFKIAEVRIAQPGIYPILKPREIHQWLKTNAQIDDVDPQATFELFLKQNNLPWIRPDMAFIPCPPFTVVGFNIATDLFLTPATDRAVIPGNGTTRAKQESLEEQEKAIAEAMEKRRTGLGDDAALVNQQATKVKTNTAGNQTIITMSTPPNPTVKFKSNEDAIRNWIINVFSPSGTRTLENDEVKISISDDAKTVTITVGVNIVDLAERARKVE